jgi:hypothetical protein
MRCDLGWDYALYGECLLRAAQADQAKACLQKAIATFEACGADGWARKTAQRLSTV